MNMTQRNEACASEHMYSELMHCSCAVHVQITVRYCAALPAPGKPLCIPMGHDIPSWVIDKSRLRTSVTRGRVYPNLLISGAIY